MENLDFDLREANNFEKLLNKKSIYLFEFAGPIGSGKSSTANELVKLIKECGIFSKENVNVVLVQEDITSDKTRTAIEDFYTSGKKDFSELENIICGERIKTLIKTINEVKSSDYNRNVIISDRSIVEDIKFIDSLMSKCDDKNEIKALRTIKNNIKSFIKVLQNTVKCNIVYLDCGLEKAIERIAKRGRPKESQIDEKKLKELTTDVNCLNYGVTPFVIKNKNMSAEDCALVSLCLIGRIVLKKHTYILVSFYGVPGSGKSHFVSKLGDYLTEKHCEEVLDRSEDARMVEEQRKIYEKDKGNLSPDDIQDLIDDIRKSQFRSAYYHRYDKFVVTDVGPMTSEVFRNFTKCKEDDSYIKETEEGYNIFINVVVNPYGVREHIKLRNRPGEYEYFTDERLYGIRSEIEDCLNSLPNGFDENKNKYYTYVCCENSYNKECTNIMIKNVMETIKNAIIGYFSGKQ